MKLTLLLITLTLTSLAQADLGSFDKQGRFIYPELTNPTQAT